MHAHEAHGLVAQQKVGRTRVGRKHALFDQAVRIVVLARRDRLGAVAVFA